jgi:hypothetical protein
MGTPQRKSEFADDAARSTQLSCDGFNYQVGALTVIRHLNRL